MKINWQRNLAGNDTLEPLWSLSGRSLNRDPEAKEKIQEQSSQGAASDTNPEHFFIHMKNLILLLS